MAYKMLFKSLLLILLALSSVVNIVNASVQATGKVQVKCNCEVNNKKRLSTFMIS